MYILISGATMPGPIMVINYTMSRIEGTGAQNTAITAGMGIILLGVCIVSNCLLGKFCLLAEKKDL